MKSASPTAIPNPWIALRSSSSAIGTDPVSRTLAPTAADRPRESTTARIRPIAGSPGKRLLKSSCGLITT